jgi:tripartite-type tricarboxylate transporter receptor subunit TctC
LRIELKHFVIPAGIGALLAGAAAAADFPVRPIRLIVPQAAGSASDTVARLVAAELVRQMNQQIVIDNRPGGALMIGMELVAHAPPDGYTIGYGPIGALAIGPNMVRGLTFSVLKDLQPLAQTTTGSMLLAASPATPFKSVREVIDYAKQYPDKLSNASSGNGTPGHVGFELFKYMTGTRIVHIPYKGGAAGTIDLIAGQVQLMMESSNSMTPHVKSGKVRGLAVSSPARSPAFRICRRSPKPACPATTRRPGPASSRRPACRKRSWQSSTRKSTPRWQRLR